MCRVVRVRTGGHASNRVGILWDRFAASGTQVLAWETLHVHVYGTCHLKNLESPPPEYSVPSFKKQRARTWCAAVATCSEAWGVYGDQGLWDQGLWDQGLWDQGLWDHT